MVPVHQNKSVHARRSSWSSAKAAVSEAQMFYNQNEGSAAREAFNDKVLGKSSSQLKAYWSRLIFTGKGTPPKESGSDADVVSLVAKNPNLVGYVDAAAVDGSVKVVYTFQ